MRDFILDREFKEWKMRIDNAEYFVVSRLAKSGLKDARLSRRLHWIHKSLRWCVNRVKEYPRYP